MQQLSSSFVTQPQAQADILSQRMDPSRQPGSLQRLQRPRPDRCQPRRTGALPGAPMGDTGHKALCPVSVSVALTNARGPAATPVGCATGHPLREQGRPSRPSGAKSSNGMVSKLTGLHSWRQTAWATSARLSHLIGPVDLIGILPLAPEQCLRAVGAP